MTLTSGNPLSTSADDPESYWNLVELEYNAGSIRHVYPNKGEHSDAMKDGNDCWCESECWCKPDYDIADDGTVMVLHKDEDAQ